MTYSSRRVTQISIGVLFLFTIMLALVPVFQTLLKNGYQGVPPSYVGDDLYYYGRMKEVADGKPFMGNPYFIEYRDAQAPAFFVADWISSIPLILGIPFSLAIVSNFIIWSLIFVYLVYLVGRATDMPPPYSAGMAFLAYCEVYWLILRPVVMQQVFPFFLLFLLALIFWIKNPKHPRSVIFLSVASALPFYVYTYLWQIVAATLGLLFLHELIQKKQKEIKKLLRVALVTGLLALPAMVYTVYQVQAQFYWETMSRIGLVESYLPKLNSYYYGRWTIILPVLYFVVWQWLRSGAGTEHDNNKKVMLAVIYSGLGLFVTTNSNVLTGKELDTAAHIGRFTTLWMALFLPVLVWRLYTCRREVWRLNWLKRIVIGALVLLCCSFLGSNLRRSLPFDLIAKTDSGSIQSFIEPLEWIEAKEEQPVVIWADDDMSVYVPILTKHYVFWRNAGGLHLMPTSEVEDRFLASRMKISTTDELFAMHQDYEGPGPEYRYGDAFYKNRLRCWVGACEPDRSFREWIGTEKFATLSQRQRELKGDMSTVMKKYHVAYLIADITKGEDKYFKSLPGSVEVWKNQNFAIYQLSTKNSKIVK